PRPCHAQLHPVADGLVFRLAGAKDIATLDALFEQSLAAAAYDANCSVAGCDKRLVVRTVLFGLLSHEPNVGHAAHGRRIELSVLLAVLDHHLIDGGVAAVWDHGNSVLQPLPFFPILPPSRITTGIDASMITSLGTCRLVLPARESTIAKPGRSL